MRYGFNPGKFMKSKSTHKSSSLRTKLKQVASLRRKIGSNKITLPKVST